MLIVGRGRFKRGMMYMVLTSCIVVLFLCLSKAGLKRYMLTACCKIALNTFCPAEFYEKPLYYYDTSTHPVVMVFGNIFPIVRFMAKNDVADGERAVSIPAASDSVYMEFCTENDDDVEKNEDKENGGGENEGGESRDTATDAAENGNNKNNESSDEPSTDAEGGETAGGDEAGTGENVSTTTFATLNVPYSYDRLVDYNFVHDSFYVIPSHTALLSDVLKPEEFLKNDLSVTGKTPCVLIYHTHSQEAFADSTGSNMTIVQVGDYLEKLLVEKYGYEVIHVTTPFDMLDGNLDRSKAYTYAQEEIGAIVSEHPEIDMVIDLHRDGVNESLHFVTDIDGKPTAKVMLFNGISYSKNQGNIDYLYNPYLEDNLALTYQMFLLGKTYYPDFFRCIYIEAYRYNLHLCKRSMLIEAGAQTNSFEEVINAMEPLSELIARELSGEKIIK